MEYVRVGWLGRTRGVGGDVWVTPDTDFPERFLGLKEIFVRNRDQWERLAIAHALLIGGRPVLRFAGISSPEEARRLTNRELAVARDRVCELPAGSHYIFELVGCAVYDEAAVLIGELVDVESYPANDVYVIRTPEGGRKCLPAARPFVKDIDTAGKRIVIDPAGLFDAAGAAPRDTGNEI
ncbi:MAG TPA: ribosome maturation factor RimM [candidate division Zixibacteria bacterium]|nr:16S rRNA processing protein RimM [candidate division Zixibacteria bacterium]MDD4917415.1 ribosome maturation factor RimM [candidate division Zixibacteria bacterium]MDM7972973.1 ribosome maturation factor RimM [candidate division Zixibacteria bacterium]HOD66929.1 ribosome maturation factor RimM [candidate division Zixibacteria bacterium]HOZ07052.1 ribosome maturation factor RimM [candidate division Zixibacteria bacterium]